MIETWIAITVFFCFCQLIMYIVLFFCMKLAKTSAVLHARYTQAYSRFVAEVCSKMTSLIINILPKTMDKKQTALRS